ncbi:hypothetical protein SAMN05192564_101551 [Paraburkholderia sartisoli]|uniref:Uncharacterized protein n=1 Tax=Paraburkholderia sartisoli TaxID=83784 RepID=A0A1H3Z181_9BURK|nr:hypothetical protein SAMN05192564_101551 [Paraburkholderia sartisoli]
MPAARYNQCIARAIFESGQNGRGARLGGGERLNAANTLETRGDAMLDGTDRDGEQRRHTGYHGHVCKQAAIAAILPIRYQWMMMLAGVVVRRHVLRRRHAAIRLRYHGTVAVCRERVRDRRGKRSHQDCKQSQQAANLLIEATQGAPGDLVTIPCGLCHALRQPRMAVRAPYRWRCMSSRGGGRIIVHGVALDWPGPGEVSCG